jgi:hypothetical protein
VIQRVSFTGNCRRADIIGMGESPPGQGRFQDRSTLCRALAGVLFVTISSHYGTGKWD